MSLPWICADWIDPLWCRVIHGHNHQSGVVFVSSSLLMFQYIAHKTPISPKQHYQITFWVWIWVYNNMDINCNWCNKACSHLIPSSSSSSSQIKVSVSSGGDCLRSYRPDIRKGRYNTITLHVKTTTPDNLLFYLGSAKYVSELLTDRVCSHVLSFQLKLTHWPGFCVQLRAKRYSFIHSFIHSSLYFLISYPQNQLCFIWSPRNLNWSTQVRSHDDRKIWIYWVSLTYTGL